MLNELGIQESHLRAWVIREIGESGELTTGQIPFTPRAKQALERALREALSLGHNYIGTEHILLGLMRDTEGLHAKYLMEHNITADIVREHIIRQLSGPGRHIADPDDRMRSRIKNMRRLLQSIDRDISTLETILEEQLPRDPDL